MLTLLFHNLGLSPLCNNLLYCRLFVRALLILSLSLSLSLPHYSSSRRLFVFTTLSSHSTHLVPLFHEKSYSFSSFVVTPTFPRFPSPNSPKSCFFFLSDGLLTFQYKFPPPSTSHQIVDTTFLSVVFLSFNITTPFKGAAILSDRHEVTDFSTDKFLFL
ncbi:unnamed protein product [Acanthosepion pharaonis]|uniref:Uncharacterized protein n=1 Tax=Acanthosepion pharaonis TaxID=158019 RepID=A0A812DQT5_ACAPH|nr:unnamed protein product [Sepia pharaonis]